MGTTGATLPAFLAGRSTSTTTIQNLTSNLCLEAPFPQDPSTPIVQNPCNNNADQEFLVIASGPVLWTIVAVPSDLCVTNQPAGGSGVSLQPCVATQLTQQWEIQGDQGADYIQVGNQAAACSGLDDTGSSMSSGSPLDLEACNSASTDQQFNLAGVGFCVIDGNNYPAGCPDGDAYCTQCDPSQPGSWTNLPQGSRCDDGVGGAVGATCDGQGNCVNCGCSGTSCGICGAFCVDTSVDDNNCGGCDVPCSSSCAASTCD